MREKTSFDIKSCSFISLKAFLFIFEPGKVLGGRRLGPQGYLFEGQNCRRGPYFRPGPNSAHMIVLLQMVANFHFKYAQTRTMFNLIKSSNFLLTGSQTEKVLGLCVK